MGELVMEDLESVTASAARGDTTALQGIYEALSPRICGYLRVRGSEDPEGLTNDVFVKVLPRIPEVVGGYRGLRAFSFSVAHGLLVDELRRRDRRPVLQEYDAARDRRTQSSAEEDSLGRLGAGTALELLALLPDDQRAVIALRVLGELSVAETADAVGRSPAAVKKLQSRALAALRGLLDSEGDETELHHEEVGR